MALGGLALALGIVSQPASALSTAGWSQADRSAATIREFQTKLMVAALRCRAAGIDVLASYNQFVAADRAELAAANDRLKAHFKSADPVNGDRAYDRYTTSLANASAGDQWGPGSCDNAARMAHEAAESKGNLLAVAARKFWTSQTRRPSPATGPRRRPIAIVGFRRAMTVARRRPATARIGKRHRPTTTAGRRRAITIRARHRATATTGGRSRRTTTSRRHRAITIRLRRQATRIVASPGL